MDPVERQCSTGFFIEISQSDIYIKSKSLYNIRSSSIVSAYKLARLASNRFIMERNMLHTFAEFLGLIYLIAMYSVAFYGLYNLSMTLLFLRVKNVLTQHPTPPPPEEWPPVTVQLPIFNEKYTVEASVQAIVNLDYPRDQLQIQILDDSTDETITLTRRLTNKYKEQGFNVECIHRTDRKGYKAGALKEGMESATGELIAIFDADFIPKPNWLKKTVPMFQNPQLGCVQTRWGHTNRTYNTLTRAEAMSIDGHFVVEQTVRSQNDFFLNFNGTAGLWRRACIEDAGGWQSDTLTEDLDLSYRAQMRGWKIDYLPNVIVPAELPSQVEAFKKQQFRWAKGSFQVVRKILPQLFTQPGLSWEVRFMAFLHLVGYGIHPLMVLLLLLTLPVGLFAPQMFTFFPLSMLGSLGPPLLFLAAAAPRTPPLRERLSLLPLLIFMGIGISLSTSIAVIQGLIGNGGTFVRTPKTGEASSHGKVIDRSYIFTISPLVWAEIGLGLYALITIIVLEPRLGWGVAPWMLIYMASYFYIAGLNLAQHGFWNVLVRWRRKSQSVE
jgi:cellulose synthase/poly-beta-1,6-N-acetylglucosamine synthase-like glycosyltransferase